MGKTEILREKNVALLTLFNTYTMCAVLYLNLGLCDEKLALICLICDDHIPIIIVLNI
jgi:hypothetical protein